MGGQGNWRCCGEAQQSAACKNLSLKRPFGDQGVATKYAKTVWSERKFTDFEIICSDRRVPCHRALLAAASPVFAKMFESSMVESKRPEAEVGEPAQVVEAMLQFIYTGEIPVMEYAALLSLADKYA